MHSQLSAVADVLNPLATDNVIRLARKRGLSRMLQALFREELLAKSHLLTEGAITWLPLWSQQGMLRFEHLYIGRSGDCRLDGGITYVQSGESSKAVTTASILLHVIAAGLQLKVGSDDLGRLAAELDNSLDNDILCLAYRQSWASRLAREFPVAADGFLAAVRASDDDNPALLLEQWATLGHPWHPNYKTKLGLSPEQVIGLSPEFEAQLDIRLIAIRKEYMHIEANAAQHDYRAWFSTTFPEEWKAWHDALARRGTDPSHWLPCPVHPFQAEHLLPTEFAREIECGDLLLLDEVILPATPTMSFRTVVPHGAAGLPHIKLPVALRLTSVQRTVSPKSAVMGPRLSALLRTVIAHERGFGETLDVLGEDIGLHYRDPDDDRARHLAVLFRANPMSKCSKALFPLPVAALMVDAPHSGQPLVTELVGLAHGNHAAGAAAFFEQYAGTVLRATLSPYLLYGIAFEAHQQNSFIMLNPEWQPVQLLVRDFGDLRIHAPTLYQSGLTLEAYRTGYTLFDDEVTVRDKLLHAVMLCHLGELAILLANTYHTAEARYWNILRHQVELAFDRVEQRTDPQRWARERHALLEGDWPAKSFVRMRLSDSANDEHGTMPNPLRGERP